MKKHITILLLVGMMLSTLASCGTETTVAETTVQEVQTETTAEVEETTAQELRNSIADDLPENDFEGRTF